LSLVFWRLFLISIGVVSVFSNNLLVKAENAEQMKQLLATKECPNCNLSKANLSNINLENANLTNANLQDANLTNANLAGANLEGAKLIHFPLTISLVCPQKYLYLLPQPLQRMRVLYGNKG
jgi:hypothetical protein